MYMGGLPGLQKIQEVEPIENIFGKIDAYCTAIIGLQKEVNRLILEQNLAKVHIKKYQDDYVQLKSKYMQALTYMKRNGAISSHKSMNIGLDSYRVQLSTDPNENAKDLSYKVESDSQFYKEFGNVNLYLSFHNSLAVKSICIDSLSKYLAITDGLTLTLIDLQTRSFIRSVNVPEAVKNNYVSHCIQFTPDDKYICLANGSQLLFYNASNLEPFTEITMELSDIVAFQFAPSLDLILIGFQNGVICQIQYSTFNPLKTYKCELESSTDAVVTGMELIDNQLRISNDLGIIITLQLPDFNVTNINNTGVKMQYGFVTCPILDKFITLSHEPNVNSKTCAAFSGNGKLFVTAAMDNSIALYESNTEKQYFKILFHTNTVLDIRHSKTINCFATCSADGNVCVWKYNIE